MQLFNFLSATEKKKITERMKERTYKEKETIFSQGDVGICLLYTSDAADE